MKRRAPLLEVRKSGVRDRADSNAEEANLGKGGGMVTTIRVQEAQEQRLCLISGIRLGIDRNWPTAVLMDTEQC